MRRLTDAERDTIPHLWVKRSCLQNKHSRRNRDTYEEDGTCAENNQLDCYVKVEVLPDGCLEECDELHNKKARWFSSSEKWRLNRASVSRACSTDVDKPRGRGRPRKSMGEGSSRGVMTPEKTGRGRPPKQKTVLSNNVRRGGIKKKNPGRGTLKKSSERDTTASAGTPPLLKKRGRPPKRRPLPVPTAEFCDNCCEMLLNNFGFNFKGKLLRLEDKSEVGVVEGTVKRGRGRPRKVPAAR